MSQKEQPLSITQKGAIRTILILSLSTNASMLCSYAETFSSTELVPHSVNTMGDIPDKS